MEIEKKYLVKKIPEDLSRFPSRRLTQSYISRSPVIRLRKIEEETGGGIAVSYILTLKGDGLSVREEYEMPLRKEQYEALRKKEEGRVLIKRRYLIPLTDEQGIQKTRYVIPLENGLKAELDIFDEPFKPLVIVEVEFPSEEEMAAFTAPDWFGEDVSDSAAYHNSTLSGIDR